MTRGVRDVDDKVTFVCPACGRRMAVDPGYAGRDGWCPACRRIFTVPAPGVRAYDDADPDERHKRLERLFQFAAARVDACRRDLNQALSENQTLLERLKAMDDALERIDVLEQRLAAAETVVERLHTAAEDGAADSEAWVAAARMEAETVQRAVEGRMHRFEEQVEAVIADLRSDGAGVAETVAALRSEVEALRAALDEAVAEARRLRESAERAAQFPVSVEPLVAEPMRRDTEDAGPALPAVMAPDAPDSGPLLQSLLHFMDAEPDEANNEDD